MCALIVPLVAVRLVDDVRRDVADLLVREAAAERGHGVLPVRHLSHDGRLLAPAGQVLVKRILAEGLLGRDDVVAAGVAPARRRRLGGGDFSVGSAVGPGDAAATASRREKAPRTRPNARGAVAREERLAGLDVASEGREGREERTGGERRRGDLLVRLDLCGNQTLGPRHRRDVVSVAASARWRAGSLAA